MTVTTMISDNVIVRPILWKFMCTKLCLFYMHMWNFKLDRSRISHRSHITLLLLLRKWKKKTQNSSWLSRLLIKRYKQITTAEIDYVIKFFFPFWTRCFISSFKVLHHNFVIPTFFRDFFGNLLIAFFITYYVFFI